MPRGGARSTSGRKPMDGARRVNIVLDEATRDILTEHGGKSGKGRYVREAMVLLQAELLAGVEVAPAPVHGETGDFPLKAPQALLDAAQIHVGPGKFFSLSEFIRTAVARRATTKDVPWGAWYRKSREEMAFRFGVRRVPMDMWKERFALGDSPSQAASSIFHAHRDRWNR